MCDFSQLLPVVESVIGRQVNGEVRSLDRRTEGQEGEPQAGSPNAPE